jgi:3-phosphoshikimate 1-carboxyvinyltransferase
VSQTVRLRRPARIRGTVVVPGDKSISHRALLLAGMAEGVSTIRGRAPGEDQESMVRCLRALGVEVTDRDGGVTEVKGVGLRGFHSPAGDLDCGNSGATMRFLAGAIAGMPGVDARLVGDASLSRRPMERVAARLRAMGAEIETAPGGTAPLTVHGRPLTGGSHDLDVPSAQVKTAILLAGLNATGRTVVREPWWSRDHTERMLERVGVKIHFHEECWIEPPERIPAFQVTIPGDPSSAAFWAVLAGVHPDAELALAGVGVNPARNGYSRVLSRMGARIDVRNVRDLDGEPVADLVFRSSPLRATDIAPEEVPALVDEVPVLAVAAASAEGESHFRGLGELRVKEVDRLTAVAEELEKLGARLAVLEADLYIGGGGGLAGAEVASRGDHRMAMALAVAASVADGETVIQDAGAAAVSYPGFFEELARVSAG